jgi:hypothetical protein
MNHRRALLAGVAVVLLILLIAAAMWLMPSQPRARSVKVATTTSSKPILLVEMRFVSSAAAEALLAGTGQQWRRERDFELWPQFLNDAECKRLLVAAQTGGSFTIVTAPRLTVPSGTHQEVRVERQTAYVRDLKIVQKNNRPTTEPVIDIVHSGQRIACMASLSTNRSAILLTLRPTLSTLLRFTTGPSSNKAAGDMIQIPHVRQWKADDDVIIPAGATAIYRIAPTQTPTTVPTQPSDTQPVLLLVKASVATGG